VIREKLGFQESLLDVRRLERTLVGQDVIEVNRELSFLDACRLTCEVLCIKIERTRTFYNDTIAL